TGLVVVTSAANAVAPPDGTRYAELSSPGTAPSATTVGAFDTHHTSTRLDDDVAEYSAHGPTPLDGFQKPDIVAPGHDLVSTAAVDSVLYTQYPERQVLDDHGRARPFRLSGGSLAAAVTSGVVALLVEQN